MARRKKEAEGFHRRQIAEAAGALFRAQGVEHTTVEEIAKRSGYSKATLYVYFRNKRDIVGELALQSMELLRQHLKNALTSPGTSRQKYESLCRALTEYHRQYPEYFQTVLGSIGFDPGGAAEKETAGSLPVERRIYETGEHLNEMVGGMLREGMACGELRPGLDVLPTVFTFWAALSGIVQMAAEKQEYLETVLLIPQERFLEDSFSLLYRSLERRDS